jgi:large subunit ribosomal protein MRP49
VRTIAPRIAYKNPNLPIHVSRFADPRTKSKDPKSRDRLAEPWQDGEQPKPVMVVDFRESHRVPGIQRADSPVQNMLIPLSDGKPSQTLPLSHLSAETILKQLIAVAGEDKTLGVDAPEAIIAERLAGSAEDVAEAVQPVA